MSENSAISEVSAQPSTTCSQELEESFDMNDISSTTNKSEDLQPSDCSKMDIDSSSSSIIVDKELSDKNCVPKKKIKLTTDHKLLKAEREQLKKEKELLRVEREKAKLEKEKEKIEKEKEKIEREKLKQKQKEEREAEKEKKQQELQIKKVQQEKEKMEKLRLKEEERERKEMEKKEKEDERNKIREAKELEKKRRNEEKLALEERKKQQDELEEKKMQKSRDVLSNFLKKSQSDCNLNKAQSNETVVKTTPDSLLNLFDPSAFKERIRKQSEPLESLYLSQLVSGKIKPYSISKATLNDDCEIIEDYKQEKYIFLQFYENTRPAYFGKRLHVPQKIDGRKPFVKEEFLDYDVDSDEEWDEGGPGESLSDSDKDHEEKDDYEIDDEFFVPHGYLSDDENKTCETNDLDPDAKPSGPLLKEQALMAERNRKFANHLSPHVIGCVWHESKDTFKENFEFLQQFKAVYISN